ncbi:MAG TPA: o-succinylbenzoate synthase [Bryobacteraceae bacterium]|nr:o-succinylbenzoate synthase [Bryobacteraceae bacterium]
MGTGIDRIVLREIRMPLVRPFETSFGRTSERRIVLVEVRSEGLSGWGEVTCSEEPFYNEEWTDSAWLILRDFATTGRASGIRGHRMARGGLEAAMCDLEARRNGVPLWQQIGGGARREIPCGVSIGIQESVDELLRRIETEVTAGYQRVKIKIKPGWDVNVVNEVRKRFPRTPLMADANSAYTLADADHLRRLDDFYLMMIEQPLAHDDIIDHAELQAKLATPICLDESIRTVHHAEQAIRLRACHIINIKLGRVGGFCEARRIHDVARAANIPVWCGGMLESGIGRAHNIALSTLPGFVLPGDVSASQRYWARDIVIPPVEISAQGAIAIRDEPGFGYEIDREYLDSITVRQEVVGR